MKLKEMIKVLDQREALDTSLDNLTYEGPSIVHGISFLDKFGGQISVIKEVDIALLLYEHASMLLTDRINALDDTIEEAEKLLEVMR